MRGNSYEHKTMIAAVERCATERGAVVGREHAVWLGVSHGFADLLITHRALRIAIEAKTDSRRLEDDVRKAVALVATHLLIVTPTAAVARACERKLAGIPVPANGPKVVVCTLGTALHRLAALLISAVVPAATQPNPAS